MRKFLFAAGLVLAMSALYSCNNDELSTDIEEKAKELGFMTVEEQLKDSVESLTRSNVQSNYVIKNGKQKDDEFVIFRCKIGRPKKDCAGFGLCDVRILGIKLASVKEVDDERYQSPQFATALVQKDVTNRNFVTLPIANSPASKGIDKMPVLKVEEQLENSYMAGDSTLTIAVPAGQYVYDKNIGPYGGYKIFVEMQSDTIMLDVAK